MKSHPYGAQFLPTRSLQSTSTLLTGNMFEAEKVYFLINANGNHWVCVVVSMKERMITYYDPLNGDGREYVENIMHYLRDEHLDKIGEPLPHSDFWCLVGHIPGGAPLQENTWDCGVFVCMFMDFDSLGIPLEFKQAHAPQFWRIMALSINRGALVHNLES